MKLINFEKYENAQRILESAAPSDVDEQLLESNGLTREDLEAVNEGLLADLFGGWFKKLKTSILRRMPGGVLKKVDKIIDVYEEEKLELMKKGLGEKEKIFKAQLGSDKDPGNAKKYEQIVDRANQAIRAIRAASNAKIDKFNTQLEQIAEDKSDMVGDYINLKIAEVKEQVAMEELKEIEKFATEEQVDKTAKEVEDKKIERENLQKELERSVEAEKEMPGAFAKKDEKWVRKDKNGDEVEVTVVEDPNKVKEGEIVVRGKGGNEYSASIESFVKKAGEAKKGEVGDLTLEDWLEANPNKNKDDYYKQKNEEAPKEVKDLVDTIDRSIKKLTDDEEKKLYRLIGKLMLDMKEAGRTGKRELEIKLKLQMLQAEKRLLQKYRKALGAKITLKDIEKELAELTDELEEFGVEKVLDVKAKKMTLGKSDKKFVGLSKENPLELEIEEE